MKCIIQIDSNGNSIGHPVVLDNFLQSYPDSDISGDIAPDGWAWFTRKNHYSEVLKFTPNNVQKVEVRYIKSSDGINFEDDFYVRDLTDEELNEKIENLKLNPPFGYSSWILETDTYFWIPPIPRPTGAKYRWDDSEKIWVEAQEGEPLGPLKFPTIMTPPEAIKPSKHLISNI
jgi:hypothetical protein